MSDFLKDIIKETGNEYASLVSDGASGDVDSFHRYRFIHIQCIIRRLNS